MGEGRGRLGEGRGRVGEGGRKGRVGRLGLALETFRKVQGMGKGRPWYSALEGFGKGWKINGEEVGEWWRNKKWMKLWR